jgi:hypothetical protein
MLVYSWLDPYRTSYGFGCGSFSVPGQSRPCHSREIHRHCLVSAAEPASGQCSTCHIIHNIRCVGHLHHRLAMATHTHTQTYNRHAPAAPGIFIVAQVPPPQHPLHLDLGAPAAVTAMPGPVAGTTRGRFVWPDGDGARPSVVVLLAVARQGLGYSLHRPWTRNYVK